MSASSAKRSGEIEMRQNATLADLAKLQHRLSSREHVVAEKTVKGGIAIIIQLVNGLRFERTGFRAEVFTESRMPGNTLPEQFPGIFKAFDSAR
jgi:hypothetical protein